MGGDLYLLAPMVFALLGLLYDKLIKCRGECKINKFVLDIVLVISQVSIFIVLCFHAHYFYTQYDLEKMKNDPQCVVKNIEIVHAVKDRLVSSARDDGGAECIRGKDIFQINIIVKNYGKIRAKNVDLGWKMKILNSEGEVPLVGLFGGGERHNITMMPDQEIVFFAKYVDRCDLYKIVRGFDRILLLTVELTYDLIDGGKEKFLGYYEIKKLLTASDIGRFEVSPAVTISGPEDEVDERIDQIRQEFIDQAKQLENMRKEKGR